MGQLKDRMTTEALKSAFRDIVKVPTLTHGVLVKLSDAEQAVEKALAKQEQGEPLFWYRPVGEDGLYEGPIHNASIERVRKECGTWKPLYTTPQQPKPLTASHIKKAVRGTGDLLNHTQAWDVTTAVMELLAEHGIEVTA